MANYNKNNLHNKNCLHSKNSLSSLDCESNLVSETEFLKTSCEDVKESKLILNLIEAGTQRGVKSLDL